MAIPLEELRRSFERSTGVAAAAVEAGH